MKRLLAFTVFAALAGAASAKDYPSSLLGEKSGRPAAPAASTGPITGIRLSSKPFDGAVLSTVPVSGVGISTPSAGISTAAVRPIDQFLAPGSSQNLAPLGIGGAGANPQNTTAPGGPSNVNAPGPRSLSTDQLPRPGTPNSTESR